MQKTLAFLLIMSLVACAAECADYYGNGQVEVNSFGLEKNEYHAGDVVSGVIEVRNGFVDHENGTFAGAATPVSEIKIIAMLTRENGEVLDQFQVGEEFGLSEKGVNKIAFEYTLPQNLASNTYYLQVFVYEGPFQISGNAETGLYAGVIEFQVTGSASAREIYLSRESIASDHENLSLKASANMDTEAFYTLEVFADEPEKHRQLQEIFEEGKMPFNTTLRNRMEFLEKIRGTINGSVSLRKDQWSSINTNLPETIPQGKYVVLVSVKSNETESKIYAPVWIAREADNPPRIEWAGFTDFPLLSKEIPSAAACMHPLYVEDQRLKARLFVYQNGALQAGETVEYTTSGVSRTAVQTILQLRKNVYNATLETSLYTQDDDLLDVAVINFDSSKEANTPLIQVHANAGQEKITFLVNASDEMNRPAQVFINIYLKKPNSSITQKMEGMKINGVFTGELAVNEPGEHELLVVNAETGETVVTVVNTPEPPAENEEEQPTPADQTPPPASWDYNWVFLLIGLGLIAAAAWMFGQTLLQPKAKHVTEAPRKRRRR